MFPSYLCVADAPEIAKDWQTNFVTEQKITLAEYLGAPSLRQFARV